jgi:hypothetical protein
MPLSFQANMVAWAPLPCCPGAQDHVGHLDSISQLLHAPVTLSLWQRLCSIAAEASALAGWLTWDLNTPAAAQSYFRAGLDAADDAGGSMGGRPAPLRAGYPGDQRKLAPWYPSLPASARPRVYLVRNRYARVSGAR